MRVLQQKDDRRDYNLDDPNKLVADGTWTYDKLFTMAETVSADLDGNDKRDEKDRYGIGYIGDSSTPICMSVGIKIAEKNNEDLPEFSFDKGENISRYLEIFTKLYNDDIAYDWHTRQGFAGETDIFTNSQALFCLGGVYYASTRISAIRTSARSSMMSCFRARLRGTTSR